LSDTFREQLGESLADLVTTLGSLVTRVEPITVLPVHGRQTFRFWLADGRSLKGRRFKSATRAEIVWRILSVANVGFLGRAVAHRGDAIVEEWIEGHPLVQGQVNERLIREAGRLLGTLHSIPPPASEDLGFEPLDGKAWLRKSAESLQSLQDARLMESARARMLLDAMTTCMPATVRIGTIHRDLCPENLIADTSRRLISVDNGSVSVGSMEYDLCRVWYRWPMTPRDRAVFNEGYRELGDAGDVGAPSLFWAIAVILNSARVRLGASVDRAAAALRRLDGFPSV